MSATQAQGTPVASQPTVCSEPQDLDATPVTSPTIPQSTLGIQRAEITLAVDNLIACRNHGEWAIWLSLFAGSYVDERFGEETSEDPIGALTRAESDGFILPVSLVSVGEPVVTGNTGTITVTTREGHLIRRQDWSFVQEDSAWLCTGMVALPPLLEVNAVGIPITITSSGISSTRDQLVDPGAIILQIVNTTTARVPVVILANPASVLSADIAGRMSSGAFDPADVVGWEEVEAGGEQLVVLSELPPGDYVVVTGYAPGAPGGSIDPAEIVQITISRG